MGLQGNSLKFIGINLGEIPLEIGNVSIKTDLYYRIELNPSFRNGKQLRKDIYVIGLKGISSVSARSEIKITFFREFDSKTDALSEFTPYGLSQIPKTAEEIALENGKSEIDALL